MLKRLPVYLALAVFSVSCGGSKDETRAAVEEAAAAAMEAADVAAPEATAIARNAVTGVDRDNGKTQFATCVACHGADGEGNMALNAPGIAGQSESYLKRQLWEFKNGQRGSHEGDLAGAQMKPMADALADGQAITDVATYVASLPPTVPPATVAGDAANGEKLYNSNCGACHGGKAWGNEALYTPRLTMLGDTYIVRQVTNFKEGMRGADKDAVYGKQMAAMAKIVSDQELDDIVAFVNELAAEE